MDDEAIDQAIFSMLSEMAGWRKVAAVVGRVADACANDLPDGDAANQTVAERIEALVGEGRLVAQGDIKNWRFSEVRLPG
jgi:hypothetical protein